MATNPLARFDAISTVLILTVSFPLISMIPPLADTTVAIAEFLAGDRVVSSALRLGGPTLAGFTLGLFQLAFKPDKPIIGILRKSSRTLVLSALTVLAATSRGIQEHKRASRLSIWFASAIVALLLFLGSQSKSEEQAFSQQIMTATSAYSTLVANELRLRNRPAFESSHRLLVSMKKYGSHHVERIQEEKHPLICLDHLLDKIYTSEKENRNIWIKTISRLDEGVPPDLRLFCEDIDTYIARLSGNDNAYAQATIAVGVLIVRALETRGAEGEYPTPSLQAFRRAEALSDVCSEYPDWSASVLESALSNSRANYSSSCFKEENPDGMDCESGCGSERECFTTAIKLYEDSQYVDESPYEKLRRQNNQIDVILKALLREASKDNLATQYPSWILERLEISGAPVSHHDWLSSAADSLIGQANTSYVPLEVNITIAQIFSLQINLWLREFDEQEQTEESYETLESQVSKAAESAISHLEIASQTGRLSRFFSDRKIRLSGWCGLIEYAHLSRNLGLLDRLISMVPQIRTQKHALLDSCNATLSFQETGPFRAKDSE